MSAQLFSLKIIPLLCSVSHSKMAFVLMQIPAKGAVAGLGLCSLVFQANCLFFVSERVKKQFVNKKERLFCKVHFEKIAKVGWSILKSD